MSLCDGIWCSRVTATFESPRFPVVLSSSEHQKRRAHVLQDLERYNSKLDDLEQRVHAALSKNSGSQELHKLETRLASVHGGGGGSGQLKELEQQVRKAT